ncbi:frizzled 5/8 [Sarotherodon galilaeus]
MERLEDGAHGQEAWLTVTALTSSASNGCSRWKPKHKLLKAKKKKKKRDSRTLLKWSPPILQYLRGPLSPIRSPRLKNLRRTRISALWRIPGVERAVTFSQPPAVDPG